MKYEIAEKTKQSVPSMGETTIVFADSHDKAPYILSCLSLLSKFRSVAKIVIAVKGGVKMRIASKKKSEAALL